METVGRIAAIGVIAAVFCTLIREQNKSLASILSLISCIGILAAGLYFIDPVMDIIVQLETLSNLDKKTIAPLIKVVGIGIVTQLASDICQDAGESALGKSVELSGSFLALYASLPLLSMVLQLITDLLGGTS